MNACSDMSDRGLSHPLNGLLPVVNGLTGIRNRSLSVCSFSIGPERISIFKCPHRKKRSEDLESGERVAVPGE